MWRVFWVPQDAVRAGVRRRVLAGWDDLPGREDAAGMQEGGPIFLSPDYRVDPLVGLYVQSATFGKYTAETKRNYATDIALLLTFPWGRGHAWTDAAYGEAEFDRIAAAARRRFRAALQRVNDNAVRLRQWRDGALAKGSGEWTAGEGLDILARTGDLPRCVRKAGQPGNVEARYRLSLKALRLYDERGVLVPARVDQASGYRYYDTAQLEEARLVVMMRQLQLPLAAVKELLACDPADAAARIAEHWRDAEAAHDARRDLADYLVSRLTGKRPVMYEVATREMPERSLLCLKRNVDEQGQWAFGKEFIGILRERPLPKIEGRAGAAFCIQWGWVSADSDGPVEWCKPVPQAQAHALAKHYPELTLRTEPAHQEAFVALPARYGAVQWQLAMESLDAWVQEQEQEHEGERLALTPEDLGARMTYLATGPVTDPDCDFAVPFAVER